MKPGNVHSSSAPSLARPSSFHHEAFLYRGDDGFLEGTAPFVRAGVEADEPVLVAVSAPRIDALRHELGDDAGSVRFADMEVLGTNPRRIIPAWKEFLDEHSADGRPVRGVGEPIWAARDAEELDECHQHEALLNLAFADAASFWLLCPYDLISLPSHVVDTALTTHPHVFDGRHRRPSDVFPGLEGCAIPGSSLPPPPAGADQITFDDTGLGPVRDLVVSHAHRAGLAAARIHDLNLAVNEIATNSVRHGGGGGVIRLWADAARVVCEVTDAGHIRDPLAGRVLPPPERPDGRGLWIASHLCDLLQIRSSESGTVVRLQMRL